MQETEVNISSTVDGVESKSPKKEIEGRRLSRNTRNHRTRKHKNYFETHEDKDETVRRN